MDELRAAIGLTQLQHLDEWNDKRRVASQTYRVLLEEYCPEVVVPFRSSRPSTHHIMPVLLPEDVDRQRIADCLRADGVQTTNHYPPIHWLSWFRSNFPFTCLPATEEFATRELTLPLHPKLTGAQVKHVARSLAKALHTPTCGP